MLNSRKIIGLCLCLAGVLVARANGFVKMQDWPQALLAIAGVLIALAGLVFFASGLQKVTTTVRICAHCRARNGMDAANCKKCRRPLKSRSCSQKT